LQQPPPGAESVEPIPTLSRAGALHRQMSRESSASPSAADEVVQVQEIASLRARLDLQKQAYNRLPRTLVLTAASARRAEEADYLYRWTEWVERVGNEHYPDEARRRQLFGDLRLAVAIGRDGNVENVEILASSGQPILDQAAVRIVRLAAPFAPIPSSISADRIEVIRTWRFMPGEVFASQAE
ncbi:MAG TPA: energy transducer TonB, partial [Porticoccaceae bacterium]